MSSMRKKTKRDNVVGPVIISSYKLVVVGVKYVPAILNKINRYMRIMTINQKKTTTHLTSLFIKTVSHPSKAMLIVSPSIVTHSKDRFRIRFSPWFLNKFPLEYDHWIKSVPLCWYGINYCNPFPISWVYWKGVPICSADNHLARIMSISNWRYYLAINSQDVSCNTHQETFLVHVEDVSSWNTVSCQDCFKQNKPIVKYLRISIPMTFLI